MPEQESAISELAERAEKSNDKYDWNRVAMALFDGKTIRDEAISIFDNLIQAFPDEDVIRSESRDGIFTGFLRLACAVFI